LLFFAYLKCAKIYVIIFLDDQAITRDYKYYARLKQRCDNFHINNSLFKLNKILNRSHKIKMIFSGLTLLLTLISFSTSTIIITPSDPNAQGIDAGVIFIQGAEIDAKYYTAFSKQLQATFKGKLWFALAEFPLSTPEPLLIGKIVDDSFTSLAKAGLKVNKDTPFFFVGHSLGGVMLQDFLFDKMKSLPVKVSGIILEGSYIERKHYDQVTNDASTMPPILALGGGLDGVNRIARMAESRYFDSKNADNRALFKRLTLIVDGMNHYQFAGEGKYPIN
jgi:hypothetical protein